MERNRSEEYRRVENFIKLFRRKEDDERGNDLSKYHKESVGINYAIT